MLQQCTVLLRPYSEAFPQVRVGRAHAEGVDADLAVAAYAERVGARLLLGSDTDFLVLCPDLCVVPLGKHVNFDPTTGKLLCRAVRGPDRLAILGLSSPDELRVPSVTLTRELQ